MQSFTTVKSVFLWIQLIGDPLQAFLNSLCVEVDGHPRVLVVMSEDIGKLKVRNGPHLSSLRRRLKKPKRWWPGGASLDDHWLTVVSRFNFLVNFSGSVVAIRLWDPGGFVDLAQ